MQLQGDFGVLRRILSGDVDCHLFEADLAGTLAGHRFVLDGGASQMAGGERIHVVTAMRLDHIALQQGVMHDAPQRYAVVGKNMSIVLEVLPHLFCLRILKPGPQHGDGSIEVKLAFGIRTGMHERQVGGGIWFDGERDTDDSRSHRVKAGGFGVDRGDFGGLQSSNPGLELRPAAHGLIVLRALAR